MNASGPRIAVLGAGPVGLEAALYAQALGLPVVVFERGRVGEHVLRWGHVRLFSPFGMNATILGKSVIRESVSKREMPADQAGLTGKEYHAVYLEPVANSLRKCLRLDNQVLKIGRTGLLKEDFPGDARRGRSPFRMIVREGKNRERVEEADVVLDCTGTYGQHRWLGNGGIPAVGEMGAEAQIAYGVENILGERRNVYANKTVMVVGGGYSAATAVCNLAALVDEHPDTWIIWLARGQKTQPLGRIVNDPLRDRDRLAARANSLATRGEGNVEFHNQSWIETLEFLGQDKGFKVTAQCAGNLRTWEVERLIANVGFSPDTALYRELQVAECSATLGPLSPSAALRKVQPDDAILTPQGSSALVNPEPNFFVLGAKSLGRNSKFLLQTGFEQVRAAFAAIVGKPDLNLYQPTR
jgi:thioredoxin reductase